jgi:hypothetical protein
MGTPFRPQSHFWYSIKFICMSVLCVRWYVCVCMHALLYDRTYLIKEKEVRGFTHTHTHMYTYIHICMRIYTHMRSHTCRNACTHTHIHTFSHDIHIYIYNTRIYTQTSGTQTHIQALQSASPCVSTVPSTAQRYSLLIYNKYIYTQNMLIKNTQTQRIAVVLDGANHSGAVVITNI